MTLYNCTICGIGLYDDQYLDAIVDEDEYMEELNGIQATINEHYDIHAGDY